MKRVYVLRHAEKDVAGNLTEAGRHAARNIGSRLPDFSIVVSSESDRAFESAALLSPIPPRRDTRAGFYRADPAITDRVTELASANGLGFFLASQLVHDDALHEGIAQQARQLGTLVREILAELADGQNGLIVSHDLTIVPMMRQEGLAVDKLSYLGGSTVTDTGVRVEFTPFDPQTFMRDD